MSNSNGKSNTGMIIAIIAVVVLMLVSSSGLGGFGYMQGWFGGSEPAPAYPADTVAPDTAEPAPAINYQGLSTACAISYKPASDQFNTAVPPFDPSKCQGVEIESNCQTWTPVQQGQTWQWQKSNNIDGCIPVQPDTVGVAQGQVYMTNVGPVVPFPTAGSPTPGDPSSIQSGGGYGKDGRWRNASDSQQIVAAAQSGRLRTSNSRSSSAKKTSAPAKKTTSAPSKKATVKPAVRRSNAEPAPMAMNTPAYAGFAPYTSGLLN